MKFILLFLLPVYVFSLDFTEIISQYDGDTFNVDLKCNEPLLCSNIPIRVKGIDTPEIKGKSVNEKNLAKKAKLFTKNFLSLPDIKLVDCNRDKYFRLDCYVMSGDVNLTTELVKHRLGVLYNGSTKITDWSNFK